MVDEAQKNFDAATVAYQKALELQPSAGEPLTALVRVDLARKQIPQAMARLDKIIKEQPKNVIAMNLRGEILMSQKDTDKAVASFNDAIAVAPRWWVPYRGLALANLSATIGGVSAAAWHVLRRAFGGTVIVFSFPLQDGDGISNRRRR